MTLPGNAAWAGQLLLLEPRVSHDFSPFAPSPTAALLESQIKKVTGLPEFQDWSRDMSALLGAPTKREAYLVEGEE
jgi:hypothetical protein